jgi:MFS family permease
MVGIATVPAIATQVLLLAAIILGLGEALYAPTADALPLALAPAGLAGRYSAIHQLAWGISGTLAPVLTAWLLVVGNQAVWLVLTVTAAVLAIAYLTLEARFGQRAGLSGVTIGASGGAATRS